ADSVEAVRMTAALERSHRVGAEQRKGMSLREAVPAHLEREGCPRVALAVEHIHHFAVCAKASLPQRPARRFYHPPRPLGEERLVGHAVDHEAIECLTRVEQNETTAIDGFLHVEALLPELPRDEVAVNLGRDHDHRGTSAKTLAQEARDGVGKVLVAVV